MAEDGPVRIRLTTALRAQLEENRGRSVVDLDWFQFFLTFRRPPRVCKKCGADPGERESPFKPDHRDYITAVDGIGTQQVFFPHLAWVCERCGYDDRPLCKDDRLNPLEPKHK